MFKEDRTEVLHSLIRAHPLGLLVSNGEDGPLASALPFHLVVDGAGSGSGLEPGSGSGVEPSSVSLSLGILQCHLARANPHWRSLDGQSVLVVFQGEEAYISPRWYPSKEEHGNVVPTWNYVMVQARGVARVVDDASWLKAQISALTDQQEANADKPWKVADAAEGFIAGQLKGIIGLEIALKQLEGKWKVSQNRPLQDRLGVERNLLSQGRAEMSRLVGLYGPADGEA